MKTISKALVGTAVAGAMAMTSAAPANAQSYRDRDHDGISAGEVIAGAVILGGIAAIAGSIGKDRYRDDRYYRNGRSGYYNGSPRDAVSQCVNAVRQDASRYGYGYARVTDIRDVDDTRYGWRVKGRVEVDGQRGYYNNRRYDRRNYRRSDRGSFTCYVDRGRIRDIDFNGIRGLR